MEVMTSGWNKVDKAVPWRVEVLVRDISGSLFNAYWFNGWRSVKTNEMFIGITHWQLLD